MSLRKSPTVTPASLKANRRNARKSTGSRALRGKAQSGLNALRTGLSLPLCDDLCCALIDARPGAVEQTAVIVTPETAAHHVFAETVEAFRQLETEINLRDKVSRGVDPRRERVAQGTSCRTSLPGKRARKNNRRNQRCV